ncbi:hypothetical protein LguiA_018807 [Lonicera macranthoides]
MQKSEIIHKPPNFNSHSSSSSSNNQNRGCVAGCRKVADAGSVWVLHPAV